MAKRAKANGAETDEKPIGEKLTDQLVEVVAMTIDEAAAEQPKRGPGRPRKERPTGTNGPTPEQEAETLAALIRLDTEAARISQEKGTVLARFEKIGGDKKAIKAVKSLLMLDKREAVAYLDRLLGYATRAEIAVTWQPDGQAALADMLAPDAPTPPKNTKGTRDLAAARAHSDGFNSGSKGAAPHDNPFAHKPGSEEYVSWHDGRDEGARAAEMKNATIGGAAKPPLEVPF